MMKPSLRKRRAVSIRSVRGLALAGLVGLAACSQPAPKSQGGAPPAGEASGGQAPRAEAPAGTPAETLPGRVPVYAGTYVATLPAADAAGRTVTLALKADMSATLTMAFTGRGEPEVQQGTWSFHGPEITLELAAEGDAGAPMPLIWAVKNDRLVPKAWSHAHYGKNGLPMERQR